MIAGGNENPRACSDRATNQVVGGVSGVTGVFLRTEIALR